MLCFYVWYNRGLLRPKRHIFIVNSLKTLNTHKRKSWYNIWYIPFVNDFLSINAQKDENDIS